MNYRVVSGRFISHLPRLLERTNERSVDLIGYRSRSKYLVILFNRELGASFANEFEYWAFILRRKLWFLITNRKEWPFPVTSLTYYPFARFLQECYFVFIRKQEALRSFAHISLIAYTFDPKCAYEFHRLHVHASSLSLYKNNIFLRCLANEHKLRYCRLSDAIVVLSRNYPRIYNSLQTVGRPVIFFFLRTLKQRRKKVLVAVGFEIAKAYLRQMDND